MRLKEFITRSGGVITAIALLGSMMSVAGAVDPTVPNPDGPDEPDNLKNKITVICHNCSSPEGSSHSHVFLRKLLTPVSVESVYGVHDIDGMTTLIEQKKVKNIGFLICHLRSMIHALVIVPIKSKTF